MAGLSAALSCAVAPAVADIVKLDVGAPLSRFALLHPGVHRYLRYTVGADGQRLAVDIWSRTVSFETVAPGDRRLHIVQRWDETSGKSVSKPGAVVLIQDSWFQPVSFTPLTHIRHVERDGTTSIGGFTFGRTSVTGMADLLDNTRKDFVMALPQPSYNFEYDMELLQTLPLAAGRTFDIPFYDAGIDKPDRYRFVVTGLERVAGPDGRPMECWLVTADYNTGKVTSRFWFAKSSQALIREEQVRPDGARLVKALLPPEAGDRP